MFFQKKSSISAIVVGLGNPGDKYKNNRHNVGFLVLDYMAKEYGIDIKKKRFDALSAEINTNSGKILLLKPQTFMNNSGISVSKAMNFYKLPSEKVVIIYDDVALPAVSLRVRQKGSAGGHNGIKSIISHIGENFCRLRIGVGAPKEELAHHVLSDISKKEKQLLEEKYPDITHFCELFAKGEVDKAMNLYSK